MPPFPVILGLRWKLTESDWWTLQNPQRLSAYKCNLPNPFCCQIVIQGSLYFPLCPHTHCARQQIVKPATELGTSWQPCPPPSIQNKQLLWPDYVLLHTSSIVCPRWSSSQRTYTGHSLIHFIVAFSKRERERADRLRKHTIEPLYEAQ